MLKRVLTILLLLLPAALPAVTGVCATMQQHLTSDTMDCCPMESAGHCSMTKPHSPAPTETAVRLHSAADSEQAEFCTCDRNASPSQPVILTRNVSVTQFEFTSVTAPVAFAWQDGSSPASQSPLNTFNLASRSQLSTCLRI